MTSRRRSSGERVGSPGWTMIPPDDRAGPDRCDADPQCVHAPCFQVQLDASRPRQVHRQSHACAYHVADVIEAQHAWATQRGLDGGRLTILAVEPAAGGRQPGDPGELRGFAFTTIPLRTAHPRDAEADAGAEAGAGSAARSAKSPN